MSQKELMTIDFCGFWFLVQYDATLLLQIFIRPDVVITRKIVNLNTHICQFRELAQKTSETLGYHVLVFVPKVEHIT